MIDQVEIKGTRRSAGSRDFIPAYSTDQLLMGVCHIVFFPKQEKEPKKCKLDRVSRFLTHAQRGREEGTRVRSEKTKEKLEKNKAEIYEMLAAGRGIKGIAKKFRIGWQTLKDFIEEEKN